MGEIGICDSVSTTTINTSYSQYFPSARTKLQPDALYYATNATFCVPLLFKRDGRETKSRVFPCRRERKACGDRFVHPEGGRARIVRVDSGPRFSLDENQFTAMISLNLIESGRGTGPVKPRQPLGMTACLMQAETSGPRCQIQLRVSAKAKVRGKDEVSQFLGTEPARFFVRSRLDNHQP